jgi:predicted acyltransferase
VGLSLTLSLARRTSAGVPRRELVLQILRRGASLYALGLFLYGFPSFDLSTWRVLGVLQRIAICYVAASLIYLWTGTRGQILWIGGLLATYTVLMTAVPVPGYGTGRFDVEGNFAHYVDRMVLGAHNYRETRTWDPEGIVSTLPAIATALFGVMAGHLFRLRRTLAERTTWLFLTGNLLVAAGLLLDSWMPINKKLWTPSFAVFMAGLDFILFAGFAWIVDGTGQRRVVRPFVILGMNAIAIYMLSELLDVILYRSGARAWLYGNLFSRFFAPADASLLFSLAYVALMFAAAVAMYRRGWFVRV